MSAWPRGVGMLAKRHGLAIMLLFAGAAVARAREEYRVVPAEMLRNWWRPAPANPQPQRPWGIGSEHPSGCAAVALRIEPDGSAHQVRIIREGWTPMSPYLHRLLDRGIVRAARASRYQPGVLNAARDPVYTYIVDTIVSFTTPNALVNGAKRREVADFAKAIARKCEVPDFVLRVARATDTPMPSH